MGSKWATVIRGLAALSVVSVLAGCVDEKLVFPRLFDPVPDEALSFVGYTDATAKLTVCGNCHVDHQGDWVQTAHADAWATLQANPGAAAFCEGCHTVNQLGNVVEAEAGYLTVAEARYHDVQCESCHGPGLDHVEVPDAGTAPLAPILVGADLTLGCGECHSGGHHPFVEEWELSPHAHVQQYAAGNSSCVGCHTGEGALARWGVKSEYLEKEELAPLTHEAAAPITCAVCHDPHDPTNTAQLRHPIETDAIEVHLCAQCHNRRGNPSTSTAPGAQVHGLEPHAPEAAMLVGEAGWFPPNLDFGPGEIFGSHGPGGNPKLCATCHVANFTVEDALTGEFIQGVTGHLFRPIPCLDANGVPTADPSCEFSTTARSFEGCASGGCHQNSPDAARNALFAATGDIQSLVAQIQSQFQQIDTNGLDAGGPLDTTTAAGTFTTAEGAWFNVALTHHGCSATEPERLKYASAAAHNPFLMRELLRASRDAIAQEYDVVPLAGATATVECGN